MKRAVITGPTGAIGTALISKLVREGTEVLAVCRKGSERRRNIPDHPLIDVIECNMQDIGDLPNMVNEKYGIFFHLAWQGASGAARNDMYVQNSNVKHSLDAVHAAKAIGCEVFIGAGSQAEYGRQNTKLSRQTPAFPENGYGMAKLCAGQMTRLECEKEGIKHIWARILSVYGPCDGEQTMIISTIRKLLSGKRPSLTAGEQMWDYIYSADAAEALYRMAEYGKNGAIYCLGSGRALPLSEYMKELRDSVDQDLELGLGDLPYSEKQVMYLCADIEELKNDTGFIPTHSFEEGIRSTIDWCRMTSEENI